MDPYKADDLTSITPSILKKLNDDEVKILSEKIRSAIIDQVVVNGGHLGSNLGAVELTIALHRVYESPKDRIIFDTGHQAYVHKILTGRFDKFETLRKEGGLSGYPNREESEHDLIENSHASTSLSYAHGLSIAYKNSNKKVIAVIGDGALTGGMAYEGLNNIGHDEANVIIIYNDNERSYAPTVSKLSNSLVKLRANRTFRKNEEKISKLVEEIPWIGKRVVKGVDSAKTAVKEYFETTSFFEDLGIRYLGPFDGHNVRTIERALRTANELTGPTVIHILTQKGKGYEPAETDEVKNMHDTSGVKDGSYTQIFSKTLLNIMDKDSSVYAITAAMPDSTGLLPINEKYPDRVLDVGIAEQHAVTCATGMSIGGLIPIVAIYSTFLTRAVDQVIYDAALHNQPVIFCLDRAGITGDDGPSHNGVFDMALFATSPNITILAPVNGEELEHMINETYMKIKEGSYFNGPIIIRWPKSLPTNNIEIFKTEISKSECLYEAESDILLIGVGASVANCVDAVEKLKTEGISIECWNARSVKPIDSQLIKRANEFKTVITVEDGILIGGFGQRFKSELNPNINFIGLGIGDKFLDHGSIDSIQQKVGIDVCSIVSKIKENI